MILPERYINYRLQAKADSPKMDKIPCDASGKSINPHDPSQWMTYEAAQARVGGAVSGVGFILNGDVIGTIEDSQFGSTFSDIWLSEQSQYPRLRRQLIGKNK